MALEWFGELFLNALEKVTIRAGVAACQHYADQMSATVKAHDNEPPSAPGETPHGQSEMASKRNVVALADSFVVTPNYLTLEVDVSSTAPHAQYLEEGTATMEPRPLWGVILEQELPTMEEMVQRAVGEIEG